MFKRIQIFLLLFFISFVLQAENITVMSINAQNLFDTLDDPEKDDKAFLPIELKQSKKHKNSCNSITVHRWRIECFFQDWNDFFAFLAEGYNKRKFSRIRNFIVFFP